MNYFNPGYVSYNPYGPPQAYNNPYQMPNQQNYQMNNNNLQQNAQNQPSNQGLLNGKIVDSEDVVKATEVPIGGYGIFPRADLSEIYIKSWNNNGTTSIITFKPVVSESNSDKDNGQNLINMLLGKIDTLDNKLDIVLNSGNTNSSLKNINKEAEVQTKNGF